MSDLAQEIKNIGDKVKAEERDLEKKRADLTHKKAEVAKIETDVQMTERSHAGHQAEFDRISREMADAARRKS